MRREDVERLADEQVAYWHASQTPLPIGEVLVSRGSRAFTRTFVNDLRPKGVAFREDHLFMVRDLDCLEALGQDPQDNFIYRVTPVTPVLKANHYWLEEIGKIALDDPDEHENHVAVRAAKNYWSGKRPPRGLGKCKDEYLTEAFRVVS